MRKGFCSDSFKSAPSCMTVTLKHSGLGLEVRDRGPALTKRVGAIGKMKVQELISSETFQCKSTQKSHPRRPPKLQ
jgi:hypothetical protein